MCTVVPFCGRRSLDLHGNANMSAALPDVFASLIGLTTLQLSNTGLAGTLPLSLSALTALQTLDVSVNALYGTIPPLALGLSTLTYVWPIVRERGMVLLYAQSYWRPIVLLVQVRVTGQQLSIGLTAVDGVVVTAGRVSTVCVCLLVPSSPVITAVCMSR